MSRAGLATSKTRAPLGLQMTIAQSATHPQVAAFIDYWRSCARGGLPSRVDFEPRRITRWLPHFLVMEMKDDAVRYRLVGSRLEDRVATSAQGRFVGEIFSGDVTSTTVKLFKHTVEHGEPLILRLRFSGSPIDFIEYEGVQAPILSPDGKDVWVVGCMYAPDELG